MKIAEVAAAAGVGVGTVSRVINGSPHVREGTRKAVLEVIDRLGYRPSRLASGLALGTTRSVGVLVPFLTRPSVVARLAGVLAVLDAAGYDCIVCNIETPEQRDRNLHGFADPHRVDGIIVISIPLQPKQVDDIVNRGVPMVLVDSDGVGAPEVVVDNVAGGYLATRHLLDLGHRRIGFIGDVTNRAMGFLSTSRRLSGHRKALAEAGLAADPDLVRRGPHSAAAAAAMARKMLSGRDPPTAIFAASDTQAIGVLQAAEQSGWRVPRDLSVVGFDDIEAAGLLGLSTIRQPLQRSGEEGAQRLCALVRGERVPAERTLLPLQLVARASTAAPGNEQNPHPCEEAG